MMQVQVIYPVSFESIKVKEECLKYGTLSSHSEYEDSRVLYMKGSIDALAHLEGFFTENYIPYDLIKESTGLQTPKLKKVRPNEGILKEINCLPYGSEDGTEDGLVAVSVLRKLLQSNTDSSNLKESLLKIIQTASFEEDEIESVFQM